MSKRWMQLELEMLYDLRTILRIQIAGQELLW